MVSFYEYEEFIKEEIRSALFVAYESTVRSVMVSGRARANDGKPTPNAYWATGQDLDIYFSMS